MSVARYSFLSWARRGIAARIHERDPLGRADPPRAMRASVPLTVEINGVPRVEKTVALHGPGDVIGLDRRAIVRTDPLPNVTDFEPNYLVSVELYDEDLPWRYTPASATPEHRLRPWLALVVLADTELARPHAKAIRVLDQSALPPASQVWAWAHVHANTHLAGPSALDAAVTANPDVAVARLLSPRRLEPNTAYTAFLLPTFESGRLAGLGLELPSGLDGMAPAWGGGQDVFPVYFEWSFRTGSGGDFESLVRLLEPRALDPRVGIRDLDVSAPAPGLLPGITDPSLLGLEGALRTPQTQPTVWPRSGETFPSRLAALINSTFTDPIVAPTFYGRWHAAVIAMGATENPPWLDELNRDPRHRSVAAFGTDVIRRIQERLAASAWQQLGAVEAANRMLVLAQLARFTAQSLHRRHLAQLGDDQLFSITAPLHARVLAGRTTVRHAIRTSQVPNAVLDRGFRRVARPRGPLVRRVAGAVRPTNLLASLNTGQLTAAPALPAPAQALTVDRIASEAQTCGPRPAFRLTAPDTHVVTPSGRGEDSAHAARFRRALHGLHAELDVSATLAVPPRLEVTSTRSSIATAIDPVRSIEKRVAPRLRASFDLSARPDPLETIMWAPQFDEPMYLPLAQISSELVLPNVGLVPQNTVSLLETNNRFVEAYLVGLNHEMARELLWREFPTDQRGTFFRRFWDTRDTPGASHDIDPLHTWSRTSSLGEHVRVGQDRIVLLVRGDMLKKYPAAVIYAVQAVWPNGGGKRQLGQVEKHPLFRASLDPDLTFLGFDLTVDEARGSSTPGDGRPGWFFVIKQRPGEPRFGLDIATDATASGWDELSWSNVPAGPWIDVNQPLDDVTIPDRSRWGTTAADMASILYQDPVLIAIHATEMLR